MTDFSATTFEDTKTNTLQDLTKGQYEFGWEMITVPVKLEKGIYLLTVKSNGKVKTEKNFIR